MHFLPCFLNLCDAADCWTYESLEGSSRILPEILHCKIPLVHASLIERDRARFAPLPWVEIGSSSSPGLATLISRQNRCALRRRVVPTGRVHWFTSWATGLLLRRVYERTRMNKTRVVRLAGIDSGPRRGSSREGEIRRPAVETRSYNSARRFRDWIPAFFRPLSWVARKIHNGNVYPVHRICYCSRLFLSFMIFSATIKVELNVRRFVTLS